MDKQSFASWAEKNRWLKVSEAATPEGRQTQYLTPSGTLVITMYDLKGNLHSIGQPMPLAAGNPPGKIQMPR